MFEVLIAYDVDRRRITERLCAVLALVVLEIGVEP